MRKNFRLASVIVLALFTTMIACKKEDKSATNPPAEMTTHSDDENTVSGDMDDLANDINVAVEASANFSGRMMNTTSICSASVTVDSTSNPRKITISYEGTNCFGSNYRSGVVVLSMPAGMHWKDAGAVLTVTYQNVMVKRLRDNKSITINGTQTFTNVTGGLLTDLVTVPNITHAINGEITVKFGDTAERIWHASKKREFSLVNNKLVIKITGTHTEGNNTQIAEWGVNRFGNAFTTSITEPVVIRQDCDFRITGGQIKHEGAVSASITFGLNADGIATSCPGTGHYYYKLQWAGADGTTRTLIFPY